MGRYSSCALVAVESWRLPKVGDERRGTEQTTLRYIYIYGDGIIGVFTLSAE